ADSSLVALVHYLPPGLRLESIIDQQLKREVSHMKREICIGAALLVFATASLWAQGDRGIITGSVKDASGAVVPGAQVTAVHLDTNTNYKTNSTASGDFTVPGLPVGKYQVRVENTGFKTYVGDNIDVAPGATVRLHVA